MSAPTGAAPRASPRGRRPRGTSPSAGPCSAGSSSCPAWGTARSCARTPSARDRRERRRGAREPVRSAGGDDVGAERGQGGGDLADRLLRDAQGGEGGGQVGDDGVEVLVRDGEVRVGGGEVAPLVQFGSAERGGDERPLMGLQACQVGAGEEALQLR